MVDYLNLERKSGEIWADYFKRVAEYVECNVPDGEDFSLLGKDE